MLVFTYLWCISFTCFFDVFIWFDYFSTSSLFLGNAPILHSRTQPGIWDDASRLTDFLSTHTPPGTSSPPRATQPHCERRSLPTPWPWAGGGGGGRGGGGATQCQKCIVSVTVAQNVGPLYNTSITTTRCHTFFFFWFLFQVKSHVGCLLRDWSKFLDRDLYQNIIGWIQSLRLATSLHSSMSLLQVASWPHTFKFVYALTYLFIELPWPLRFFYFEGGSKLLLWKDDQNCSVLGQSRLWIGCCTVAHGILRRFPQTCSTATLTPIALCVTVA